MALKKEFKKNGYQQEDSIRDQITGKAWYIFIDFYYENDDGIKAY